MDITIREARPEEYQTVGELTARAFLDNGLLIFGKHDPYTAQLLDAATRAAKAELLVAVDLAGPAPDAVADVAADTAPDPTMGIAGNVAADIATDTGADTVVGTATETVVGTVTFASEGPYTQICGPDEAEFRMLAVSSGARGRGIGEALIHACAVRARDRGKRRLVISVTSDNVSATRLYQRLGFVVEGVRRDALRWDGRWHDTIVMGLLAPDWRAARHPTADGEAASRRPHDDRRKAGEP
jgi:ribosomal protein S18 acetylase RimI-like enzyme